MSAGKRHKPKRTAKEFWTAAGKAARRFFAAAGKFLACFVPMAAVGFFCLFGINLIFPNLINKEGENTTLKYSLAALALVLIATAVFVLWTMARRKRDKGVSWWLAGAYAGFILGVIAPVTYMIISASSGYILPYNPYWG